MFTKSADDSTRFWSKVQRSDGCWLWTAGKLKGGYGFFRLNGRTCQAHRYAYLTEVGPIPSGMEILHSCDTPSCVNPAHLSAGTHRQNMIEMAERITRVANPPRGEACHFTRITEDTVRLIRSSSEMGVTIALRLGVSKSLVSQIRRREVWKHVA